MRRRCMLFLVLFLLLPTLTGCWNRKELNDLAIVVGMSIDKLENEYMVTVQVVDPAEVAPKKGGSNRAPVITYEAKGVSIFEATRRMTTVASRRIYLSHMRILVLGEALAKEGMKEALEFLSRNNEVRTDFFVVVAREAKGAEILKNITPLEKIPAQKLYKSLETSEKNWAPTYAVQMDELIHEMSTEGISPVLSSLRLVGDPQKGQSLNNVNVISAPSNLQYANLAVFRVDKLVGWMNELESKGFNYIRGNVKNTVGSIKCDKDPEKIIAVELFNADVKVSAKMGKEGPTIMIEAYAEGNIGEMQCNMDITKPATIEQLEKKLHDRIQVVMESSVKKAKQLKTDVFGFGEVVHRSYPKAWKGMKKEWGEHFAQIPVEYKINARIRRTGTTNKSYIGKGSE